MGVIADSLLVSTRGLWVWITIRDCTRYCMSLVGILRNYSQNLVMSPSTFYAEYRARISKEYLDPDFIQFMEETFVNT